MRSPRRAKLAATSSLKAFYLSHFSQPACERILYRIIQKNKIKRILELGLGDGQRAVRMIEMAQRQSPECRISYAGTDLFESRSQTTRPGVTLKAAYQMLGATGARIHLIPGDPFSALSRTANTLSGTDLVVISACEDQQSSERAWFYLPRVIHPNSLVVREENRSGGATEMRLLGTTEIVQLASEQATRRAA